MNALSDALWDGSDGNVFAAIGGATVQMIIDSGAAVNAISNDVFNKLMNSDAILFNMDFNPVRELRAYASEASLEIVVRFQAKLSISFEGVPADEVAPVLVEEFYVIKNAVRCLLSKDTSRRHNVLAMGEEVRKLKRGRKIELKSTRNYKEIFEIKSTEFKEFEAFDMEPVRLKLRKDVVPTQIRYTNIPFHMRDEATAQITELVKLGIIEEVEDYSKVTWISSMLAVIKPNGKIRIVVDFRGLNKAIIKEPCGMPTLEEIISKLANCEVFSTIDLTNAFYHVKLHEESRHVTTFWTGEKYYQFTRLAFGLSSAPDIFQRAMQDVVLKGCTSVLNYSDDILVYTETAHQHETQLEEVMSSLSRHNVKLNTEKCKFMRESVTFLGFTFSRNGISITEDKLNAFINLREPESVSEVKSYLGMLTFLERFIIDRASKTSHLRKIANSGMFLWTPEAQAEFNAIKETELKRIANLDFFNKDWRTELFVDASPSGLGAILAQFDTEKNLHVICCASKALTPTEQRYPQQHREALAIVWGIERFKFYLLGSRFTVRTDNRANEFIFGTDAYAQGKRAISRSQLFALRLQSYNFKVKRVAGKDNAADALSRLISHSQADKDFECGDSETIFAISSDLLPITLEDIEKSSLTDELFTDIQHGLSLDSWANKAKGLRGLREKLRIWGGILYLNERFYVPESLRVRVLEVSHIGHISATTMKQLLRAHAWWPGMTVDADSFHADCRGCSLTSRCVAIPSLSPRALPRRPLEIVHLDFLKLTGICELLVVTEAYSRYLWVVEMKSTSTKATNKALMSIFDCWGKPQMLQSDNGPQFISKEFKDFWKRECVETRTTIPYASHTNGLVERHNGPIIHAIRVALVEEQPWKTALANYVKSYNTRPHSTTLFSPFHLLQGRKYHDYLPIFDSWDGTYELPPARSTVKANHDRAKARQKLYYDQRNKTRDAGIKEGDWVVMKNMNRVNKMEPLFLVPRFRVMRIHNSKAIIRSANGKDFIRWIGHLKLDVGTHTTVPDDPIDPEAISDLLNSRLNISDETDEAAEVFQPTTDGNKTDNDETPVDVDNTPVSKTFNLRNRKLINIPARYLDCMFIVHE